MAMRAEFSEFSYGYAVVREAEALVGQTFKAAGAPLLPSLKQEEAWGFDAKISYVGYALFFQFKRADYVSREHPASPTWPHVGAAHYRWTIDTDGHQHAAMIQLEKDVATGLQVGDVLYAAPRFHAAHEFDEAYRQAEVLDRSTLSWRQASSASLTVPTIPCGYLEV